jgi:hypothetical protein
MINQVSEAEAEDSSWKSLYRVGGATAWLAAAFAFIQIIIEIIGVGVMGIEVPTTVNGWFTLLQSHRLLGLTELTLFQIPVFVLMVPTLLALSAALKRTNKAYAVIATALACLGIAVYLASNTVFSMLSLSNQYAAASTDAQRSMLLAAGHALLAIYEGLGVDVGLFLILAAILMLSALMWRSSVFSRVTAYLGILAGVLTLAYYIGLAFTPTAIFILEAAGLFMVAWVILVGQRLYQLGSGNADGVIHNK